MTSFPPHITNTVREIASMMDPKRYQDTLENLVRIPSISGEEGELAHWISNRLIEIGIKDAIVDEGNNMLARVGNGKRRLLISAHMDTMKPHPEMRDPFTPRIVEEGGERKLYGLGTASAKACLASIIEALTVLVDFDPRLLPTITFVGVACDLHPTIHGIKEVFRLHELEADSVLVGEPTNLRIGIGARGYAHAFLKFTGQPHHAGRPNQLRNPIVGAAEFINHALSRPLPEHPLLGAATLTPIEWNSEGQRPHTPQSASVLIDRRLVPEDPPIEILLDRFKEWAKLYSDDLDVDLELWRHQFPWEVSTADPIVASLAESFRVVIGKEPDFYPLPFSSSSGFFMNVPKISPVAFSGGDIAQIGPLEHSVISQNVLAAGAIAGAVINFENLG